MKFEKELIATTLDKDGISTHMSRQLAALGGKATPLEGLRVEYVVFNRDEFMFEGRRKYEIELDEPGASNPEVEPEIETEDESEND